MKIAMVFDGMVYGGIERVGINYIQMFLRMGHQVDVYVLNKNTENIIHELDEICDVKVLDFKKTKCPEAYWGVAVKKGAGKFVLPVAWFVLTALKPLLRSVYGVKKEYNIAIAFSGHYNDLTFVADNYIRAKHKLGWLHGAQYEYYLLSPGYYELYKKIKNLVCLSELCDAECFKFNLENGIRKRKIYNPIVVKEKTVDPKRVQELKSRYGDFCLMVARLSNDKDQKTAILAMKYLKENLHMEKNLLLVGNGNTRQELEAFVKEHGMEDQVFFMGLCSDVQNYYSAAAVYVHSSPLEGLPTVLLEALSFDLPIAATDSVPGVREILGNNDCGLTSPVGDPKGLAENILKLYEDSCLREKLIENGKVRIMDFNPETIEKKLNQLFEDLMN